jgi:glycosyltransferase involved in cell wall biosynthesis
MRILLIPELYPTDQNSVAGIFINDQIRAIQKFADVVVYNTNPFYRGVYAQLPDVDYYDFHLFNRKPAKIFKPFLYRFWETKALELALKIQKIDLVHIHGAALRGNMALRFAQNRKIPLVVTEHTGPWSAISARPAIFERVKKVLKHADIVLPVSHHLKNEMLNSGVEMEGVEVLGNPVDGNLYNLRTSELSTVKRILFVGRLDEFKGAMRTLKAYHSIVSDNPDWKLLILGAGPEGDEIRSYIEDHKLSESVEFIEAVFDRAQLANYYRSASFLVFPSRFESFGLVAAEAMATGLPVLCTNQTGPLDYSLPENSLSVDPDSIEDIARGMRKMIDKIQDFHPERIRSSVLNKFGIPAYSQKLEAIYRSTL